MPRTALSARETEWICYIRDGILLFSVNQITYDALAWVCILFPWGHLLTGDAAGSRDWKFCVSLRPGLKPSVCLGSQLDERVLKIEAHGWLPAKTTTTTINKTKPTVLGRELKLPED